MTNADGDAIWHTRDIRLAAPWWVVRVIRRGVSRPRHGVAEDRTTDTPSMVIVLSTLRSRSGVRSRLSGEGQTRAGSSRRGLRAANLKINYRLFVCCIRTHIRVYSIWCGIYDSPLFAFSPKRNKYRFKRLVRFIINTSRENTHNGLRVIARTAAYRRDK